MKTYSYTRRGILFLVACLCLGAYAAPNHAMAAEPQPRRASLVLSLIVRPSNSPARLIIRRDPGIGRHLIIHLSIDGSPAVAIAYGRTYEGFLSPGRHVLSLLPTPDPKWRTPSQRILDVRGGETYSFMAMGNSGYIKLKAPGEPETPRGR
jgi:hypothetical protein